MGSILDSPQMEKLSTIVEEATRSTEEGVKYFVEPAGGSLRRSKSKRHHIVFGRRGSGKSSLLHKAASDLTVDRAPIATVDLEPFKGHSYPDLLLSVLIAAFSSFKTWLDTAAITPATNAGFWKKFFGGIPSKPAYNRKACQELAAEVAGQIAALDQHLHSAETAEVKRTTSSATEGTEAGKASAGITIPTVGKVGSELSASQTLKEGATTEEQFRRSKIDFLRHHVMNYQRVFDSLFEISGSEGYLFLDDLYHIKRQNQPQVLDYFHSIAKGHHLWVKIGTIRHRTDWYIHGDPPVGLKLGDDADEIDLDLTLEKYALTKKFLVQILNNLSRSSELSPAEFITDGAIDRLVLASGGVARDFLSIFRRAIDVSRERSAEKISAEDVNMAAGEYEPAKREEFKRDTYSDEEGSLNSVFQSVRDFCLVTANSNCFLINKDAAGPDIDSLHELVDLKLLHLIRSRVTVNSRGGQIYEAYMLDLSQYAGARKRRGLEVIEFWKADSTQRLRRVSLIFREKN
jgi:hypothetical protein